MNIPKKHIKIKYGIAFLVLLLGSVFDWKDILCYGIGCAVLFIKDSAHKKV